MAIEIETTVLGGLPVTIEGTIQGAEPDVGIMSSYVDEWYITAINGRPVKSADWIMRRLSKKDEEAIVEELNEAASEY